MGICSLIPACGRCGQDACVHDPQPDSGPGMHPVTNPALAECEGYVWPSEIPVPPEFQGEGGGFGGAGGSGGW